MSARSHIHPTWDGAAAGPARPTDVVDAAAVQAERLRRAVGFRVDGPEGRIGRLRAFVPGDVGGEARMRVDVAAHLLREGSASVAEIAGACGYSDQSAFTRQFKQIVGQTPMRYRANAG